MIVLDKIGDFSEMTEYYNGWLSLFSTYEPNMIDMPLENKKISRAMVSPNAYLRSCLCNISLHLLALEQEQLNFLKNRANDSEKSKMETVQNKLLEKVSGFSNIQVYPEKTGTDADKFFQFRNVLAHANYQIVLKDCVKDENGIHYDSKNVYIKFDNGKIKGEISYRDLNQFVNAYEMVSELMDLRKQERFFSVIDSQTGEIKLKKIKFNTSRHWVPDAVLDDETTMQMKEYGNLLHYDPEIIENVELKKAFFNDNDLYFLYLEKIPVTDEEKKIFKEMLSFIGEENWKKMKPEYRYKIVNDYLLNELHKKSGATFDMIFRRRTIDNFDKGNNQYNITIDSFFEGPLYYSYTLLEYAHYCFGLVREVNAKEDENIFFHTDIPFEGIDMVSHTGDDLIKSKKKSTRLLEQRKKLTDELTDNLWDISQLIKNNNLDNRDPKRIEKNNLHRENLENKDLNEVYLGLANAIAKENKLDKEYVKERIKFFLENQCSHKELNEKDAEFLNILNSTINKFRKNANGYAINTLDIRIYNIDEEVKELAANPNLDRYEDSTEVFRRLRNAINHGNYTIDYSSISENGVKDFSKIKFSFRDYNPETGNLEFEINSISGKRLLELINEFNRSVMNDAKKTGKENRLKNTLLKKCLKEEYIAYSEVKAQDDLLKKERGEMVHNEE